MPPIVLSGSLTDRPRIATHCVLPITGTLVWLSWTLVPSVETLTRAAPPVTVNPAPALEKKTSTGP